MTTSTPPPKTAREWVGRNIRRLREERRLTVHQLAGLLTERGFLIDKSQVSRIETGRSNVDVEKLLAFADALEVTPDRLLRDPERLDIETFVRIRRHWRNAEREAQRHAAIAGLLLEELTLLAGRIGDDPETGWSVADSLGDDAWEDSFVRWIPSVERVAPESPGYVDYIERLAAGDLTVDYSELTAELERYPIEALFPSTTKSKSKRTKKGGK